MYLRDATADRDGIVGHHAMGATGLELLGQVLDAKVSCTVVPEPVAPGRSGT